MGDVYLLDYGAGNVRSLVNAVHKLGYTLKTIDSAADFDKAEKILFPGVGEFGHAMRSLEAKGFVAPLKAYLQSGRPFFGICVGMQTLFEGSEEAPQAHGLGVIPGRAKCFDRTTKTVPHIGWNRLDLRKALPQDPSGAQLANTLGVDETERYYFVHSFAAPFDEVQHRPYVLATTRYGDETFVSAVQYGRILGTQFHPEKSGPAGLRLIQAFLAADPTAPCILPANSADVIYRQPPTQQSDGFTTRIIACLDVRDNDQGDLVVTKGDQYDVRERDTAAGDVRNLGKPVELAETYYRQGADEITFLNITSFRNVPMQDLPMLEVLRRASENIFVPLTVGGGIRDVTDPDGRHYSALAVAGAYFRSGADKVSIGSDAVYAAEAYWRDGQQLTGTTAIEAIANAYGAQAVVISVDPRRVYVADPADTPHHTVPTQYRGPNGEQYCWYQCTVKGGREGRDLDVRQLVVACQALGAGEILLNCMDRDGTNAGYDLELIRDVKQAVTIPVIASSGAGHPAHFAEVIDATGVEATLAAGIFHRKEVPIATVKEYLTTRGYAVRPTSTNLD
ncbi:Histidine biosynthesis bifunctional protein hisB [Tieghemiomyces parasiticus]|uniref:Imidazole glycerol phosphate synthase hisHF n=1 Tax=Tieghemiomyces parasiticus TaxID=78921 RepID=A0A9W8ABM0_9FUNG|nr:Histidine biosynthesis bifunctional protein hisB [Tieghemiomyces parasiticus]